MVAVPGEDADLWRLMLQGTSLGLSIVSSIVAAYGGRVTVESELGRGSTFRVVLPSLARC
jgi:signal transduction histidine kinase